MMLSRRWVIVKHFEGLPKAENYEMLTEPLPKLKEGEILLKSKFFGIDPFQRVYPKAYKFPLPCTVIGGTLAQVIESRNPKFPEGCKVMSYHGWRDYAVVDPSRVYPEYGVGQAQFDKVRKVVNLPENFPDKYLLSVIGPIGLTAYFGFLKLMQPLAGETVVVSGAAGSVGSTVCQLARNKGCTVIGLTGTKEKSDWLMNDLRVNHVINYKEENVRQRMAELAPDGVDIYFDNVGGEIFSIAVDQMKHHGRIAVCGAIQGYNEKKPLLLPPIGKYFANKELSLEGFMVWRWKDTPAWDSALYELIDMVAAGNLIQKETIMHGFEKLPDALLALLTGQNTGKMLVKAEWEVED